MPHSAAVVADHWDLLQAGAGTHAGTQLGVIGLAFGNACWPVTVALRLNCSRACVVCVANRKD